MVNFLRLLLDQTLHDGNFVMGAERRVRNRKFRNPHYSFNSAYVLLITNTIFFSHSFIECNVMSVTRKQWQASDEVLLFLK